MSEQGKVGMCMIGLVVGGILLILWLSIQGFSMLGAIARYEHESWERWADAKISRLSTSGDMPQPAGVGR